MILISRHRPTLSAYDVTLLRTGEQLLYGNHPTNRSAVMVVEPGRLPHSVRVEFLEDYATNRPNTGNSRYRTGSWLTAKHDQLWYPEYPEEEEAAVAISV